jgi:hypothetical protein
LAVVRAIAACSLTAGGNVVPDIRDMVLRVERRRGEATFEDDLASVSDLGR